MLPMPSAELAGLCILHRHAQGAQLLQADHDLGRTRQTGHHGVGVSGGLRLWAAFAPEQLQHAPTPRLQPTAGALCHRSADEV